MQNIIRELLAKQGEPSVSIILPSAYHSFSEKNKVQIALKNSVHKAEKTLLKEYPPAVAKPIVKSLHNLVEQIDWKHPPESIAFFVTTKYAKNIALPFPVIPKTIISDTFEIQDLLYNLDKSISYYVVHLSKKHTRLFQGMGPMLQEIRNDDFPQSFEDPYQTDRSSPYALHTNEPSTVDQRHLENFWRQIAHLVATYVQKNPLILIGLDKYTSFYKKVAHDTQIIGELHGNYDQKATHELYKLTWPVATAYQGTQEQTYIQHALKKLEKNEAFAGIQAILENMRDQAYHLLVEKDLEIGGYLHDGNLTLQSTNPEAKAIPNLIEHVIERILRKKHGKVDIVTPNALKDQDGIILLPY